MNRRRRWLFLIVALMVVVVVEYQFGDLLMDSKTKTLTPLTKTLLVLIIGSTGIISFFTLLKRIRPV